MLKRNIELKRYNKLYRNCGQPQDRQTEVKGQTGLEQTAGTERPSE